MILIGFRIVRLVIFDNGDLIFASEPAAQVDQLASLRTEWIEVLLAFSWLSDFFFADWALHGMRVRD